jgi:hypothetical protein
MRQSWIRDHALTCGGSVAKNILTTFYSGKKSALATISCVASEFLQQSRFLQHNKTGNLKRICNFPDQAWLPISCPRESSAASTFCWTQLIPVLGWKVGRQNFIEE